MNELKIEKKLLENDSSIMRYLSIPKFFDIILNNKLALTRLDLMEDKYEGDIVNIIIKDGHFYSNNDTIRNYVENMKTSRNHFYISSWCLGFKESHALWKIFTNPNEGLLIKVKIKSIERLYGSSFDDIYLGKVIYFSGLDVVNIVNGRNKHESIKNYNAMIKLDYFDYENEVRFVFKSDNIERIKYLEFEAKELIYEVVFSPNMPEYIKYFIKKTTDKLGFDFNFKESSYKELK